MTDPIEVTDEDRARYLEWSALPPADAAAVRAGEWDNTTGMRILAAHRIAAEARGAESERARVEVQRDAIVGALKWDAARNYIMPYRVRDALRAALSRHADQGEGL